MKVCEQVLLPAAETRLKLGEIRNPPLPALQWENLDISELLLAADR